MSTSATLTIDYATVPGFPAGSVVDHIRLACIGATTGPQPDMQFAASLATGTYTVPGPDTYTFTAQGMPATGAGFGTPVSASVTLTAGTTASISLPASMTVA